jgi:autotransporter-associated beta strand protein
LISATPRTIGLNGGALEGFLYTDHMTPTDQRTVGPAVTLNLLADSYVGQNIQQGFGYDTGRAPTVGNPFGDTPTGSYLRIEGPITGAGNLTKTGLDTATIASTGNSYGNTIVEMGVLRIGANDALPTGKTLTTRTGGTFDLFGNNQTVAGLGVVNGGANPGGVSLGSSGRIINSGVTDNTLRVNSSANYTYNGTIEQNVALTKAGSGTLTLTAANTYAGATRIEGGTLILSGSISGTKLIDVQTDAKFDVSAITGGFRLAAQQTLMGNGTIEGSVTVEGTVSPGASPGTLTFTGPVAFADKSTFSLEIAGDNSYDRLVANGVTLSDTVNLVLSAVNGLSPNTSFLVLDNTSAGPVSGFFTWNGPEGLLSEGERFTAGAQEFIISYAGGTGGNDVILTTVPEPGAAATLLAGVGMLLGLRRNRRR